MGVESHSSRLRIALVWLVALKIAGLLLVIDPWAVQASDLPKSIFSRALAWPMAGLVVALLARYGFGVIPRSPMHLAVLGLLTVNALSAVVAESRLLAIFGDYPRFLGLGFLADMAVLYIAVGVSIRSQHDWGVVVGATLGSFILTSAYAAVQAAGLDPVFWTDDPGSRPFSTFGYPGSYGHILSVFMGVALGCVAFGEGKLWRVVAALCILIGVATGAGVAARGTLLGVGAAMVGMACIAMWSRGLRGALIATVLAGAVTLTALLLLQGSPLTTRALATLAGAEVRGRLALYDVSLAAWRERPLLGYGVDNFGPAFVANHNLEHYTVLNSRFRETSAHSWPLQAAATTGALGLAALVGVIGASTLALLTSLRTTPSVSGPLILGSIAYWTHAAINPGAIGVDWFPWLTWGAVVAIAHREAVSERPARAAHVLSLAVLPFFAAIAVLTALPSVLASHAAWEARDAVHAREGFRAIPAAATATAYEPLRADHWNWLGLSYEIHGRWQDEADAFTHAADLAPHEIQYRVNAARSYAQLRRDRGAAADLARARHALELARTVDPNNPLTYEVQAEVELAEGQFDAALAQALVAHGIEPRGELISLIRRIALTASPSESRLLMIEHSLRRRESAPLLVTAAEIAMRLGLLDRAREHLTSALQLEPGRPDARRLLDQLR